MTVGYTVFVVKFYVLQSCFPLFWSSFCTRVRLEAMDANQTRGHHDLDMEMDILRSLTARTPSLPRRSTVEIEEEGRNDAVGESSGVSVLPKDISSGQTNQTESEGFHTPGKFSGKAGRPSLFGPKVCVSG